jgi:hypothetical protein
MSAGGQGVAGSNPVSPTPHAGTFQNRGVPAVVFGDKTVTKKPKKPLTVQNLRPTKRKVSQCRNCQQRSRPLICPDPTTALYCAYVCLVAVATDASRVALVRATNRLKGELIFACDDEVAH